MLQTFFIFTDEKDHGGDSAVKGVATRDSAPCDVASVPLQLIGGDGKVVAYAGQQWGEFKPEGEHVIMVKVVESTDDSVERDFWDWIRKAGYEGVTEPEARDE